MAIRGLDVLIQRHIPELFAGLFTEILDKEIDYALFEAQFDGDILAENDLALEHVVVGKHEFYAGHQVLEFLVG